MIAVMTPGFVSTAADRATMQHPGIQFDEAMSYAAEKLGIESLNKHQRLAVRTIVDQDVFVCLPTGYGKSICFQSVTFIFDYLDREVDADTAMPGITDRHIAVIVEPTAVLMRDHVESLISKGVSAAFINNEQDGPNVKKRVQNGEYKFVYISPESLDLPQYQEMLLSEPYNKNLCIFCVDEAHCVLAW